MGSHRKVGRKMATITIIGTQHKKKKTGSPIVRRRSRPQTAQHLTVRMTATELVNRCSSYRNTFGNAHLPPKQSFTWVSMRLNLI